MCEDPLEPQPSSSASPLFLFLLFYILFCPLWQALAVAKQLPVLGSDPECINHILVLFPQLVLSIASPRLSIADQKGTPLRHLAYRFDMWLLQCSLLALSGVPPPYVCISKQADLTVSPFLTDVLRKVVLKTTSSLRCI